MASTVLWVFGLIFLIVLLYLFIKITESTSRQNNYLYVVSCLIVICMIATMITPLFIGYSTVTENGTFVAYTDYTTINHYNFTNDNFMQTICEVWNNASHINKISVSKPVTCLNTHHYKSLSNDIYLFVVGEFVVFFMFMLILCNYIKECHKCIIFTITLFMIFWLSAIIMDIGQYGTYQESNYVKFNNIYRVSGYTASANNLDEMLHKKNFTNVYSLCSGICELSEYFDTDNYLFIYFNECQVHKILGPFDIIRTNTKIIALIFLFAANLAHYVTTYTRHKYDSLSVNL